MAELKTRPTKASVGAFLATIRDAGTRSDAKRITAMMKKVTDARAEMWGPNIVGFGRFQYKKDGAEWPQLGFAPRKDSITVYLGTGLQGLEPQIEKLGNPACGKGCLYVPALAELSEPALEKLLRASLRKTRAFKPR
jgi:hypothetical protein